MRFRIRTIAIDVFEDRGGGVLLLGSLSSDVFDRRTSTGSESFSLLISLDATKFYCQVS